MTTRKSVVAGQFYPDNEADLRAQLVNIYTHEKPNFKRDLYSANLIGGIVPHAGYMYSGYEAVHFFDALKHSSIEYDTIIIVNPSHSGAGPEISVDSNTAWDTPLGAVNIDIEFADQLELPFSDIAQRTEHSGEVMLPYLKFFLDYKFKIVPITMKVQSFKNAQIIAKKIYQANKILKRKVIVIASSDFSHYLSPEKGIELDNLIVEEIQKLNSQKIEQKVIANTLSICGFGPIMTLIEYSKLVSAQPRVDLLRRGSSGEVVKSNSVVDYITFLFH